MPKPMSFVDNVLAIIKCANINKNGNIQQKYYFKMLGQLNLPTINTKK